MCRQTYLVRRLLDDLRSALLVFSETFAFFVAHLGHHLLGEGAGSLGLGASVASFLSHDIMRGSGRSRIGVVGGRRGISLISRHVRTCGGSVGV